MHNNSKMMMGLGIVLILITGAIHLIDVPSALGDATYKGWLFITNGLFAVIAAIGIYRGEQMWGWRLGAFVAASALLGYVASRTIGLPQLPAEPDAWLEPLGVVSVIAEGLFLALYALSSRTERVNLLHR